METILYPVNYYQSNYIT